MKASPLAINKSKGSGLFDEVDQRGQDSLGQIKGVRTL